MDEQIQEDKSGDRNSKSANIYKMKILNDIRDNEQWLRNIYKPTKNDVSI